MWQTGSFTVPWLSCSCDWRCEEGECSLGFIGKERVCHSKTDRSFDNSQDSTPPMVHASLPIFSLVWIFIQRRNRLRSSFSQILKNSARAARAAFC